MSFKRNLLLKEKDKKKHKAKPIPGPKWKEPGFKEKVKHA